MEIKKIERKNGDVYEVIVDDDIYNKYEKHNWYISLGKKGGDVRPRIGKVNDKRYEYLSRLVLNCTNGRQIVDHINHNTLDNRRCNLRIVSAHDNNLNCKKPNKTSKYLGVTFCKSSKNLKWRAQLSHNQYLLCKMFATEIEAAKQFNLWAKDKIGGNCLLNIIN